MTLKHKADLKTSLHEFFDDFLRESLYELYEKGYVTQMEYQKLCGESHLLVKNYIKKEVSLNNLPYLARMTTDCFVTLREGK